MAPPPTDGEDDTGGPEGWSIANESHRKSPSTGWGPTVTRLAFRITIRGTTTSTDTAPRVETAIPDQTATAGRAFSYAFPDNTFTDLDGDTLAYTATKADDAALPLWLTFTAVTRTFSGNLQAADVGTVSVKVTARDGNGGVGQRHLRHRDDHQHPPRPRTARWVTASEDTDLRVHGGQFQLLGHQPRATPCSA